MIENQLIISIILWILFENEEKISEFSTENFEVISNIAIKWGITWRIIELILNHIHRSTICIEQLAELKSRQTHINWTIVEDSSNDQLNVQSSFGMTKQHRYAFQTK